MRPKNHQRIPGFLSEAERASVIDYVNTLNQSIQLDNVHLNHLIKRINGNSFMFDISKSELSNKIADFQSNGNIFSGELPPVIHTIQEKIVDCLDIPNKNSFLQIVDMQAGGTIGPHYDAAWDGWINYKCNVSVLSEDYWFNVDNEKVLIQERDLYCFSASLYKHWTPDSFSSRRILLSFGFMLNYADLGVDEHDPRVRLSRRIEKYFQKP